MIKGFRIVAPYFVAGGTYNKVDLVTDVAPIISYMRGWYKDKVINYCKKKNWEYAINNSTIQCSTVVR